MKKIWKIPAVLILMICIFGSAEMTARAENNSDKSTASEMNQVMTMLSAYEAKVQPGSNASSGLNYEAGAPVWVVGKTQNGWYKVSYQGKEGYIPVEYVTDLQVDSGSTGVVTAAENGNGSVASSEMADPVTSGGETEAIHAEAGREEQPKADGTKEKAVTLAEAGLDDELAALEAENKILVEEVERQRSETKSSRVWLVVIAVLIIGIFVTGILSAIKGNENGKKNKANKDKSTDTAPEKDTLEIVDLDLDEE